MRLILVRHADAEPHAPADAARPLTPLGHRQAADLAAALSRVRVAADAVLTSPLARARETAAALAGLLPAGRGVEVYPGLAAGDLAPGVAVFDFVRRFAGTLVLVGHMPDLAELAGRLTGAQATVFGFEKAAAACFVGTPEELRFGAARVEWVITPEWSAAVAATSP